MELNKMRFKYIENVFGFNENTRNSTRKCNEEKVRAHFERRMIAQNCQKIASGVLIRLNINGATKELTTLLGDCDSKNNLAAVTGWIISESPEQYTVSRTDIDEFSRQLRDYIEEQLNW